MTREILLLVVCGMSKFTTITALTAINGEFTDRRDRSLLYLLNDGPYPRSDTIQLR